MSFLSIEFLVFLAVLFLCYFLVPGKWQWKVLLCANIFFYFGAGIKYAGFILVTAISAWGFALLTEHTNEHFRKLRTQCTTKEEKQKNKADCTRKKKLIMVIVLGINFGIWTVLKFTDYIMPLGLSFYTFIAMGYCIDVYRGKYVAERDFCRLFLFISFFPHIVQGPFSRYDKLRDSLAESHSFSFERMGEGIVRILWGFFKKLVIAERLSIVTNAIYAHEDIYGGIYILVLMVCITLQLYADFSGYMDIACGICRVLGIPLQENFLQPFFSRSIEEVWRRWHITLGAWFRDYVFYSVSMSKFVQKIARKCKEILPQATARLIPSYIALAAVWTMTGLWHGKAWNFLIWGWMNMFFIIAGMQLTPFYKKVRKKFHIAEENRLWGIFCMIRTFLIFGYMEMFSDSSSTMASLRLTKSLFTVRNWNLIMTPEKLFPELTGQDLAIVIIGVSLLLIVDILKEKKKDLYQLLVSIPIVPRYIGYAMLFYAVILLGNTGTNLAGGFMYANF